MNSNCNILLISNNNDYISAFSSNTVQSKFMIKAISSCEQINLILPKFTPDIVFCDLSLLTTNNNDIFRLIRSVNHQAIINMLLDKNDRDLIFHAMSFGISNYLIMPMNQIEILNYLKQCEYVLRTRHITKEKSTIVKPRRECFSTNNNLTNLPILIDNLLSIANPCLQQNKSELRTGLEELIINAIEHGNLNISFKEKSQAILNNTFEDLLTQRQQDKQYKDKIVSIIFHQEPEYDEWYIKDEGKGFDLCELSEITNDSAISCMHGRGIMISRFQFDEIEYSENGTKVRVRRYAPIN
ncbi:MAG: response regulator [Bacteroidales bacterium]|nr:response regulator [Bacteroidales bacterium]